MEMNNQPPIPQQPSAGPKGPHGHSDWAGHSMWCNCQGGHRHSVLRIILGLILLGLVFCFGFKVGWLHANMYGGGGYDHHRGYPMMRYYPKNMPLGGYMMDGNSAPQSTAPSQPATPAPAPVK